MRVAVLDIGTNTVLLLIADVDGTKLRMIRDDHAIARLGEGVDRTHRISEEAFQRFLAVMRTHNETIRSFHVDEVVAVGTSALRDATNRDEIVRRTKEETGIEIEILSGEEEARWTYRGALAQTSPQPSSFDKLRTGTWKGEGGIAVVDIGGGSTEISFGNSQEFSDGVSLDIGAVRITERYFSSSLSLSTIEKARAFIRAALDHPPAPSYSASLHRRGSCLVAVAGTPTTLAAMHQNLEVFDAAKVHGYVLRREAVGQMLEMLFSVSTAILLERFPGRQQIPRGYFTGGTLILAEVMDYLGAEQIIVSTQGLRYGIALRENAGNPRFSKS